MLLVSVHCNAAGNGQWMTARGWSAYTTPGHTKSDILAESLYTAAAKIINGQHFRTDRSDGDSDIEERFYILKNTNCAAVLTENLFQDNKEDVSFLLSDLGKSAIIELHDPYYIDKGKSKDGTVLKETENMTYTPKIRRRSDNSEVAGYYFKFTMRTNAGVVVDTDSNVNTHTVTGALVSQNKGVTVQISANITAF